MQQPTRCKANFNPAKDVFIVSFDTRNPRYRERLKASNSEDEASIMIEFIDQYDGVKIDLPGRPSYNISQKRFKTQNDGREFPYVRMFQKNNTTSVMFQGEDVINFILIDLFDDLYSDFFNWLEKNDLLQIGIKLYKVRN